MTKKSDDYVSYKTIIQKVEGKIKNNRDRISYKAWLYPVPTDDWANNLFTFPYFPYDDNDEDLETLKTDLESLKAEYIEEYKAIDEALSELGFEPNRIWKGSQINGKESGDKFWDQINENLSFSNQVLMAWEAICIPIRIKGNYVFLVRNPSGLVIEPRILVSKLDRLAINSIFVISEAKEEIKSLSKKLEKWQIATFILGIVFFIAIMIIR